MLESFPNHPPYPCSVEKLSSTKLGPGAKMIGDHCHIPKPYRVALISPKWTYHGARKAPSHFLGYISCITLCTFLQPRDMRPWIESKTILGPQSRSESEPQLLFDQKPWPPGIQQILTSSRKFNCSSSCVCVPFEVFIFPDRKWRRITMLLLRTSDVSLEMGICENTEWGAQVDEKWAQ